MVDAFAAATYEEFECALSLDKHIVKEPISLQCGHCICKSCIPLESNAKNNTCKVCGKVNDRDLTLDSESIAIKKAIKRNLYGLLSVIVKQLEKSIENLKCKNYKILKYKLFN